MAVFMFLLDYCHRCRDAVEVSILLTIAGNLQERLAHIPQDITNWANNTTLHNERLS
jgi:hypothetical protein